MRSLSLVRIRLVRLTLMALMGALLAIAGLSLFWIIGMVFVMVAISVVSMFEADKMREESNIYMLKSFLYD